MRWSHILYLNARTCNPIRVIADFCHEVYQRNICPILPKEPPEAFLYDTVIYQQPVAFPTNRLEDIVIYFK